MPKIVIDPITRIEGHLKLEAIVEDGVVKEAKSSGMLWRGFEVFLKGRNPVDAQRIAQRICGVCPTAHSTASTLCLDDALQVRGGKYDGEKLAGHIPDNGRIARNLILGSNYIQSHLLHFYHLTALDYVDVTACADATDPGLAKVVKFIKNATANKTSLAPFFPRYDGPGVYRLSKAANQLAVKSYVEALEMRKLAQEMLAIFGGHMPHNMGVIPGGITEVVTVDKIANFRFKLEKIKNFINNQYIPIVLEVAKAYGDDHFTMGAGCKNMLVYGSFELDSNPDLTKRKRFIPNGVYRGLERSEFDPNLITEQVKHSWFKSGSDLKPSAGETEADREKGGAYSWMKSPRYDGEVFEVGPVANQISAYLNGVPGTKKLVDAVLSQFNAEPGVLFSVLGRHAARAIECSVVAEEMSKWLLTLKPGEPTHQAFKIPEESEGMGITSAPRGSLGHWITIKNHKIERYQAVVPTTWNGGPRDDKGQPGPFEQAVQGTKVNDINNPVELVRIIRSFDPCLACAIHMVNPKGTEMARFVI